MWAASSKQLLFFPHQSFYYEHFRMRNLMNSLPSFRNDQYVANLFFHAAPPHYFEKKSYRYLSFYLYVFLSCF